MPPFDEAQITEFKDAMRQEVQKTYADVDKKATALGEVMDEFKKKLEGKADTTDIDGRLKDLTEELKKAGDRADEIERKANRGGLGGGGAEHKSAGQLYTESDEYKQLQRQRGGRQIVEMKAITSLASPAARNPLQTVQSVPGIIAEPDRPLMVRDLLPVGTTTSLTIEFPKENVFTNAAAPVAENTTKPESGITFTAEMARVATIAHWIAASKQVLDDASFLQGYIDNRLRMGLMQKEDTQLLNGDGTGTNMLGLIPQATAYDDTGIPGVPTIVDTVRWMKLQVRKSYYSADAVVLNPADWAALELLKDTHGAYLYAAVTTGATPRLWGMRVVESDEIAEGNALVGAFSLAAQIWDRQQASVMVSTENGDNFVKNMATILAEERLALTVYRPKSFVYGALTPPAP
ncbi:phage major capsid protein [Paroceanicella profunda]|nr:phage major capsid protein [Paroceanicella profunda]